jgi:hypothetical protein
LQKIGLQQCPNEPCLFRLLHEDEECFLLLYVDDALIVGKGKTIRYLQKELKKHFDSKFERPKDFLGLDITKDKNGTVSLSMASVTNNMCAALHIQEYKHSTMLTLVRTDKKIVRGEDVQLDPTFRSKVGSLMWLCMGIQYDIAYTTKELSRILQEPTQTALSILDQTLNYISKTRHAHLRFNPSLMRQFIPPPTRQKITDTKE